MVSWLVSRWSVGGWLVSWLVSCWSVVCRSLVSWFGQAVVSWSDGQSVIGQLVSQSVVGWSVGLVSWLVSQWLVGQLVSLLVICSSLARSASCKLFGWSVS